MRKEGGCGRAEVFDCEKLGPALAGPEEPQLGDNGLCSARLAVH
jgi:hypothetical protein